MTTARIPAPDEGIRDLVYFGDDGYLYFHDVPENKRAIASNGSNRVNFLNKADCKGNAYPMITYKGMKYKTHRIVWWLKTGEWPDYLDHINHDRKDYRFENLRKATQSSNLVNRKNSYNISERILSDGSTAYYPRVSINRHYYNVGFFRDKITALYAAWKIREILYPGFCSIPDELKEMGFK